MKKFRIVHEYRYTKELKKLKGNPRIIYDDDFNKLCKSIKENDLYFEARPIILSDRTGDLVIIAGNQRLEAAKTVGLKEVPTVLIPDLTIEKEKELVIRDNVNNGRWDFDALANEWDADELHEWGVETPDKWKVDEPQEQEEPEGEDYTLCDCCGQKIKNKK